MNEKLVFEGEYKVTINDMDCFDRISILGVLNIFQDAASRHASMLDTGYNSLMKKNATWILIRTKYDVINVPKYESTVTLTTWQSYRGKAEFERDYLMYDENGDLLIKGTSKWCIVDVSTRRILPSSILENDITHGSTRVYEERFDKLNFEDFKADNVKTYDIMPSQLDHNFHMNNTKYSEVIINHIDLGADDIISSFEINYVKETKKGDRLTMKSMRKDKEIFIEGFCNNLLAIRSKITLK